MREDSKWLLLVFTLPTSKASERVQMWRKLQRFGSIPFRNAGSLLPNTPENQERFEWLAAAIRASKGEASILQVQDIDDVSSGALQNQFRKARAADYTELIKDLQKLKPSAKGPSSQVLRLRRRFEEIVVIDFFYQPITKQSRRSIGASRTNRNDAEFEQERQCFQSEISEANLDHSPTPWNRPGLLRMAHLSLHRCKTEVHLRYQPRRASECDSVRYVPGRRIRT